MMDDLISREDALKVCEKYNGQGTLRMTICGSATNCDDNINELHYCFSCGARMEVEG